MVSSELQSLLEQYLNEIISEEDFKRLWKTLDRQENDAEWFNSIESAITSKSLNPSADHNKAMEALAKIKARISAEAEQTVKLNHFNSPFYKYNRKFLRYAATILLLGGTVIFIQTTKGYKDPAISKTVNSLPTDVCPGGEKALLTLADGTSIVLDSVSTGMIAQQGHVQIIKLANGRIQYKALSNVPGKDPLIVYNTMSTPRGGQYQLVLPDSSKVWLNAESSITYPIAFIGNERKVKISGEAYFEVAKDKNKPFRVLANDIEVEVLGTHFNINAYADAGAVKTSLLEGSVKINSQVLKPGEAYMNGKIVPTDTDQDVAWKNGIFNFNDQNLSQIMFQLARWYNLEVVYPQGVPKKEYGGEIGRNLNLAQVLKGLENSGVHFDLEGRQLFVK